MKNIFYILSTVAIVLFSVSCGKEDDLGDSNIDTTPPVLNSTDIYLRENFTSNYNIEVFYKWDENKVDFNRYLFPPNLEKVIPTMDAVKTIWLDTYNEVAGPDFVKLIAPREILLVGGINLNPSGTITLGLAEGGKRITFFNTDLVDLKDKDQLIRFVSTIQHEYTHILNQTVPFDIETYGEITPSGYTAQWFNESTETANELGFITDYARANEDEDFAEMITALLSYSGAEYQTLLDNISSRIINNAVANALEELGSTATDAEKEIATNAAIVTATPDAERATDLIKQKEAIVVEYFKSEFDLDIYELQRVAAENVEKVLNF